jgi:hypothetical protein
MKTIKLISLFISLSLCVRCIPDDAKGKMKEAFQTMSVQLGDQYFKTAISLIELHKLRYGNYPETLDSIKFTGIMDKSIFPYINYTRLDEGYSLEIINIKGVNISKYPAEFWKGTGLKKADAENNLRTKDSIK